MRVVAVKVKRQIVPGDDLFGVLSQIRSLKEGSIVAISSKVVSICENRVFKKSSVKSRDGLIIKEADRYLPRKLVPKMRALLTIKNHALLPSAGVDEFDGLYVLWPKDPGRTAKKIYSILKKRHHLAKLGVIICDSRSTPLRRGSTGFSVGYFGFSPLKFYRGKKALSGRIMRMRVANVVDALAAAAVLVMGEGGERTPIAVIEGVSEIEFLNSFYQPKDPDERFEVDPGRDIFSPLFSGLPWQNKKSSR
ncbi:MAG: coenzyme F420-0:L-glutamate ligase [Candidatus Doudnabacteria bacterium]|nr:coenzyme F420-0:L-glutamate ligase [Candidatus Doudnabacteria bacterium]